MQTQSLGSGPCFDSLRTILDHERDTLKSKTACCLQKVRRRIRSLDGVDPEHRLLFLDLLRERTLSDLDAAGFPNDVLTHLRCCVVAIFRNTLEQPQA